MKKTLKPLLIILAAFIVFSGLLLAAFLQSGGKQSDYTLFNTRQMGVSLLYDTLKNMDYAVQPEYQRITGKSDIHISRILIEPHPAYISEADEAELLNYVFNGGRVIYLTSQRFYLMQEMLLARDVTILGFQGDYALIAYGRGEIFLGPAEYITNDELLTDQEAGLMTADILAGWNQKEVWINEACHGFLADPSLWDALPLTLRLLLFQAGLIVILLLIHFGKRFGNVVPLYSETEREENEYLLSLAAIYERSGKGILIFEEELYSFFAEAAPKLNLNNPEQPSAVYLKAWGEKKLAFYDCFLELLSYKEEDLNTRTAAGRTRLNRALLLIKRLESCLR